MVESTDALKNIIKAEYPYLKNYFGIRRIGIFGSFSVHKSNKDSDIDLVVEFDKPIGFKFMALAEFLENKLGRKVDILTPDGLKSIRVKQVAERIRESIIYV
ncbi:MAG TPA: nucleotidyltransferase domain-containing protein [Candidatus Deferrimicrobium sp.]|nr:nucleotidyltransferase domain-containing protein [Candidatus Kapabacteria bacterium]HLP62462.1 nucleotidyltransferase domain-containing protein [Candidatus Deferrimicrobium sp.]